MSRPKPVPRDLICSECGLDWDDHPKNPRKSDCIKLLRDKLSRVSCTHVCCTCHRFTYWGTCSCSCHGYSWPNDTTWTWTTSGGSSSSSSLFTSVSYN